LEIQTERLENHTARFTVNIDADQFEKAKKQSARKLSKRYNIPGFRKGKAPYRVVANYLGEAPIIEDAMETLGNEIYKKALDESDIEPYGPGALEDFKLDPVPTYIFSVPLQPEVELGDYRSLREDYVAPEITDEQIDAAFESMREEYALVETSTQPAAPGNRLTINIHAVFADGEERPEEDNDLESAEDESPEETSSDEDDTAKDEAAETESSDADDEDLEETVADDAQEADEPVPYKGDMFIHRHDFEVTLDADEAPVMPGFVEQLVGAEVDSTVEFELEIPDEEMFEGVVGRKVHFEVGVETIEMVTLPELNDDLAARITEDEDEPLTLLQLRMQTRENMQKQAEDSAKMDYAEKILSQVIEQAKIAFPEEMVKDQIEEILHEFDQNLRERGLNLEAYIKVMNTTREEVGEQSRERAEERLRRSLVMGELLLKEAITIDQDDITARIDEMMVQFGEQGASLRQFFDTPQMQSNIANELMYQKLIDRLIDIGTGKVDESVNVDEETAEVAEPAGTESNTEVEEKSDTEPTETEQSASES